MWVVLWLGGVVGLADSFGLRRLALVGEPDNFFVDEKHARGWLMLSEETYTRFGDV